MTSRDRARLERALERRRADLERWTQPLDYQVLRDTLAPIVDLIQSRREKAERARAEVLELEAKLRN